MEEEEEEEGLKEKREVRVEQAERRRLDKSQISSPCGFRHTVSVRISL